MIVTHSFSHHSVVCLCVHPNTLLCFDRKEIGELGMTLVINARKKAPPPHLYKALLMAQVKPQHLQQPLQITCELQGCHDP